MKRIVFFLLLWTSSHLLAQLTLPDFFVDEPFPEEEIRQTPGVPQTGAQEEPGQESREAAPATDENARRMLQQMNMGAGGFVHRHVAPQGRDARIQSEMIEVLTGGPHTLSVEFELADGRTQRLKILNQTLLIDTGAMRMPVRLNDLASMERSEADSPYLFRFKDGDELRGTPDVLRLLQKDGENPVTLLSLDQLRRIRF